MTAARLYEIVRDVPEAATPDIYHDPFDKKWREVGGDQIINTDLAEAAFVGAMVAYLGCVDVERYQTTANDPSPTFCVRYGLGCVTPLFPTLIEALAAACKEAK